jgi:hypothetical protein
VPRSGVVVAEIVAKKLSCQLILLFKKTHFKFVEDDSMDFCILFNSKNRHDTSSNNIFSWMIMYKQGVLAGARKLFLLNNSKNGLTLLTGNQVTCSFRETYFFDIIAI